MLRSLRRNPKRRGLHCDHSILRYPTKAVVEQLERRVLLAAVAWDGGPTGNGTNFLDPTNWVGDVLPGATDTASIGATGTSPTISISGTVQVQEIDTSRSLNLSGTIRNVTVAATGGASMAVTGNSTLDGVTLNTDLAVTSSTLTVVNGLTLNGMLSLTSGSSWSTQVFFDGSQTLGGTGEVVFGGTRYSDYLYARGDGGGNPATLTIGPDITIHGGIVSNYPDYFQGFIQGQYSNDSIFNQGTINADAGGRSITVKGNSVVNTGTLEATNGGSLTVNGLVGDAATLYVNGTGSNLNVNGSNWTLNSLLSIPVGTSVAFGGSWTDGAGITLTGGRLTANSSAAINDQAYLISSLASAITLNGSLLGDTTAVGLSNPQGSVTFSGSGTSGSPQLLEAMSRDHGMGAAGYSHNFVFGTLALSNKTYVKLVDQSINSTGPGSEAVYTNSLIVPSGCTLDLNGLKLYARAAQIDGTVIGSVQQTPDSGALTVDTPTPGKIDVAGELDEWSFFGRAGRGIAVLVNPSGSATAGSPAPVSPVLNWAQVSLLAPDGSTLADANAAASGQVLTLNDITLPADGIYKIRLRAATGQSGGTGNYYVAAYDVTADTSPLLLNQNTPGNINAPFNSDRWTFSLQAGRQIRLDLVASAASGLQFTLDGPGGYQPLVTIGGDSDLITIPAGRSGQYVLTAKCANGQAGAYNFAVRETTLTDLPINTTFNGTLFGDGVCARIKEELLKEFNLHTVVRLPNGVFAPYTPIPTNLLFFDRSGPTKDVWYYEQPLPEGKKNYTKTNPIQLEEFADCINWWTKRKENERAWKVPAKKIIENGCNLDIKNPTAKEDLEHLPPEKLVESIVEKERRILEIMGEIKELLKTGVP